MFRTIRNFFASIEAEEHEKPESASEAAVSSGISEPVQTLVHLLKTQPGRFKFKLWQEPHGLGPKSHELGPKSYTYRSQHFVLKDKVSGLVWKARRHSIRSSWHIEGLPFCLTTAEERAIYDAVDDYITTRYNKVRAWKEGKRAIRQQRARDIMLAQLRGDV